MILNFDTKNNEKQKECARYWLDNSVTDIVYGGAKATGKSYLGCSLIFGDAFIYPETHYFIARRTLNDLRKFTIPSIHEVFNSWGIKQEQYTFNGQFNYFELYNGSKIYLLDAKDLPSDPDFQRFGSMQMTRGWIEEAGEFSEKAKNNLQISIGRWKNQEYGLVGKLLQTCNPAKNYLYKDYYRKNKDGVLEPHKRFIQALPGDNKSLDAGYLENLHRTLTGKEKERLLFGNWEYDDDPSVLIDYDAIIDLFTNTVDEFDKKYLIADIARRGQDKTVINVWEGYKCVSVQHWNGWLLDKTAEKIKEISQKYKIPFSCILIDEDGVGGGVVDILRGVKGFTNNATAFPNRLTGKPDNFQNLKTQCYYLLAEYINAHRLAIECETDVQERIIEELEQVKSRDADKDGKLKIQGKDVMKKLLGRSPDFADTLMMRMYFEFFSRPEKVISPASMLLAQSMQPRLDTSTKYE